MHSESRKQKKKNKNKTKVATRKRDTTRAISVISLSEVYPIPERHRVSASARETDCVSSADRHIVPNAAHPDVLFIIISGDVTIE